MYDFYYVFIGYDFSLFGEFVFVVFYLVQFRFFYYVMCMVVIIVYIVFLNLSLIVDVMDVIVDGWFYGWIVKNIFFVKWEEEIDILLEELW